MKTIIIFYHINVLSRDRSIND